MYLNTFINKDHVAKLVRHQILDLGMQVQVLSWSTFMLTNKLPSLSYFIPVE